MMSYCLCLACVISMRRMGTWVVLHMVWAFVSVLASTVLYLTLRFVSEAEHIQAMDKLVNDKPDAPAGYDAIDALPLMVAQFSSDKEDDKAEEEDMDSSL